MSLHSRDKLAKKLLQSKSFRETFIGSRISQVLAMQLRILRQQRDLSQADLAQAIGTSQNAVSRMENPRYGKYSVSTLKKLAAFFDVGLVVRFAPYGEVLDWVLELGEDSIAVPCPDSDKRLLSAACAVTLAPDDDALRAGQNLKHVTGVEFTADASKEEERVRPIPWVLVSAGREQASPEESPVARQSANSMMMHNSPIARAAQGL